MTEEFTFVDYAVLSQVEEDTVVEKFGSRINSSFFDAANILGTLKQKGLIDFKTSFPGPSEVFITEKGKLMMGRTASKASEPLDKLDELILGNVANGYKEPKALAEKMNLAATDLCFHLARLAKQGAANYMFKSGRVEFSLTEEGFRVAGYPKPASKEELKKEEHEIAEILATTPSGQNEEGGSGKPMKLNKVTRAKAKAEYYARDIWKYAIAAGVIVLLVLIALVYFFVLKR